MKTWFEDNIDAALAVAPKGIVDVHLYITAQDSPENEKEDEKALPGSSADKLYVLTRPLALGTPPSPSWA
jgi:hypothetical protein